MAIQDQTQTQARATFRSLEEEAFTQLMRTAFEAQDRVAEFFKRHDISDSQHSVLRILRAAGNEGLSCGDVAARMVHRDPDVTRLCDRMVKRGLVARSRSLRDRRVVNVRITQAGIELVNSLQQSLEKLHQEILRGLGPEELRQLTSLLEKTRTGLTAR